MRDIEWTHISSPCRKLHSAQNHRPLLLQAHKGTPELLARLSPHSPCGMAYNVRTVLPGVRRPCHNNSSSFRLGPNTTPLTKYFDSASSSRRNLTPNCSNAVRNQARGVACENSLSHIFLRGKNMKGKLMRYTSSFETHTRLSWLYSRCSSTPQQCFASEDDKMFVDDAGNLKLLAHLQALPVWFSQPILVL